MWAAHEVPVLLIVFNRPDKTLRSIDALRTIAPRRLFVAADGPRPDVPSDRRRCADTRACLRTIDWPCEVALLEQARNLGCKRGPESAISWFFTQVGAGIILEDDCLATPDFFRFCAELLDRFRDDDRLMMISGHNMLGPSSPSTDSYVFSHTTPTWGWATWRRAWRHYDPAMSGWDSPDVREAVRARMSTSEFRMMSGLFDQVHAGELQAWDFAWSFTVLRLGGLSAIPTRNLIKNIGFGDDATHTKNRFSPDARLATAPLPFPLVHPVAVERSEPHEKALHRRRFPLARRIILSLPAGLGNRIRRRVYAAMALLDGADGDELRPERCRVDAARGALLGEDGV